MTLSCSEICLNHSGPRLWSDFSTRKRSGSPADLIGRMTDGQQMSLSSPAVCVTVMNAIHAPLGRINFKKKFSQWLFSRENCSAILIRMNDRRNYFRMESVVFQLFGVSHFEIDLILFRSSLNNFLIFNRIQLTFIPFGSSLNALSKVFSVQLDSTWSLSVNSWWTRRPVEIVWQVFVLNWTSRSMSNGISFKWLSSCRSERA